MEEISIVAARAALAVLLLGTVLAQVLVPQLAVDMSRGLAEVSHLAGPYSAAAIVAIACVQGALLAVWRLLGLVRDDRIVTARSLRWLDAVAVLVAAATVVAAGPAVHLLGVVRVGGPGVLLSLAGGVAGGGTTVVLVVVARQALARAIAERSALEPLRRGSSRPRGSQARGD